VNLRFIFDRIFSVERGGGYPAHRAVFQKEFRIKLEGVSAMTHRSMSEIIRMLPDDAVLPVIGYPGMKDLIDVESIADSELKEAFLARMGTPV
jgi:hypothetical protein